MLSTSGPAVYIDAPQDNRPAGLLLWAEPFAVLIFQLSLKLCIDRDSGNGTRGGGAAQMI